MSKDSIELSRHPGEHVEEPRSRLCHGSGPQWLPPVFERSDLQQFNFTGCQVPDGPHDLIASKSRPGIADVRLIRSKGMWAPKQNKKEPLCGSKHHETELCTSRDREFSRTTVRFQDMASPRSGGYWPDGRGRRFWDTANSRYPTSLPLRARTALRHPPDPARATG